ncbi:helix-turn-helix domain-containing protein [Nocardioides sp. NPDC057764]|uniref:helix-turn-helix domain-containing protein n=1 Tax=Nocardioides sp. NPDC057764 TaxID=3346243 RepID=UPI00366A58EB
MTTTIHECLLPTPDLAAASSEVLRFLQAHEPRSGTRPEPVFLSCGADEHERVEVTEEFHSLLKDLVGALAQGKAVQVLALEEEITTQQAADLLGLSRPTVVKLVDSGDIPARVPGRNRRKLRLVDVMNYRDRLYEQRNKFIAETSTAYEDVEEQQDIDELLNEVRKGRL